MATTEFRDENLDRALAKYYGQVILERKVVDGQRGYLVTMPNGCKLFRIRLGDAMRSIMFAIGHAEDREILIIGEPEEGNCW